MFVGSDWRPVREMAEEAESIEGRGDADTGAAAERRHAEVQAAGLFQVPTPRSP